MNQIHQLDVLGIPASAPSDGTIPSSLLDIVLRPYRPECRYLKRAWMTTVPGPDGSVLQAASGDFSIPESFYIENTGHFNAVEFILCFNQLAYTLVASGAVYKRIPEISVLSLERFVEGQTSDILILDVRAKFRSLLDARSFTGTISWQALGHKLGLCMVQLDVTFRDHTGKSCSGSVKGAMRAREFDARGIGR